MISQAAAIESVQAVTTARRSVLPSLLGVSGWCLQVVHSNYAGRFVCVLPSATDPVPPERSSVGAPGLFRPGYVYPTQAKRRLEWAPRIISERNRNAPAEVVCRGIFEFVASVVTFGQRRCS